MCGHKKSAHQFVPHRMSSWALIRTVCIVGVTAIWFNDIVRTGNQRAMDSFENSVKYDYLTAQYDRHIALNSVLCSLSSLYLPLPSISLFSLYLSTALSLFFVLPSSSDKSRVPLCRFQVVLKLAFDFAYPAQRVH